MPLKQREFNCANADCDNVIDRDYQSSLTIDEQGLMQNMQKSNISKSTDKKLVLPVRRGTLKPVGEETKSKTTKAVLAAFNAIPYVAASLLIESGSSSYL